MTRSDEDSNEIAHFFARCLRKRTEIKSARESHSKKERTDEIKGDGEMGMGYGETKKKRREGDEYTKSIYRIQRRVYELGCFVELIYWLNTWCV